MGFVARLENCPNIDLVVAWRNCNLTLLERMVPNSPCTLFFQDQDQDQDQERKALYTWYHHTTVLSEAPPTLQEATRWIAIKGASRGARATAIRGRRCCGMACSSWTWPLICILSTIPRNGWGGAASIHRGISGRYRRVLLEGGMDLSVCKDQPRWL